MQTYAIFGGTLRSSFPFPDLPPVDAAHPRWSVARVESGPDPIPGLQPLGEEEAASGLRVRLYRTPSGLRLEYDRIGTYDLGPSGGIRWYPGEHDCLDCARQSVLGRVLAASMYLQGTHCLHGSAVGIGGEAVAFLAPKGAGKSTLAAALVGAGARLATDDMLPVLWDGDRAMIPPGVQRLRLRHDAAGAGHLSEVSMHDATDGKRVLDGLDAGRRLGSTTPLAAVYLLEPAAPDAPEAATREDLHDVAAALALVRHATIGGLLAREAGSLLGGASRIVGRVPVRVLRIARDHARLAEAVERILEWHGAAAAVSSR
jgi:hypothetical protein